MQPYFLPYLGYFSLIESTEHFIFFDTPQYIRRGWMNRNRILHPKGGDNYIIVPINKQPQNTPINRITISQESWKNKILRQLESVYKKNAPYYTGTIELVRECVEKDYLYLAQLNIDTIINICEFIGLPINYSVFSEMDLKIEQVHAPDEWALNITKAMDYDTYRNAVGGQTFFDNSKYAMHNIRLEFVKNRLSTYNQKNGGFIPGLSIIDVLMFNSPSETLALIKNYDIITGANDGA